MILIYAFPIYVHLPGRKLGRNTKGLGVFLFTPFTLATSRTQSLCETVYTAMRSATTAAATTWTLLLIELPRALSQPDTAWSPTVWRVEIWPRDIWSQRVHSTWLYCLAFVRLSSARMLGRYPRRNWPTLLRILLHPHLAPWKDGDSTSLRSKNLYHISQHRIADNRMPHSHRSHRLTT
jgi:hypothetical protein